MKRLLNTIYILFVSLLLSGCFKSQLETQRSSTFDREYVIPFDNAVVDKNFFLLSRFERVKHFSEILDTKNGLSKTASKYILAFNAARENCNGKVECIDQLLRISDQDISQIGHSLGELAHEELMSDLIYNHLRPSGMYTRYDSLTEAEFIEKTWTDVAIGLNNILDIYGLGNDPRYAEIDKVSFDVESIAYQENIQSKLNNTNLEEFKLFYQPTLSYALALLSINQRDESGRYEPMIDGENKAVYNNLTNIAWDEFEYSMILVLGDSPNSPGDLPNISLGGMVRVDHGVQLFKAGKAPILAFSGGHVRPFQTKYNEAVEMKKYVMEKYGIDESKILIDPHARHTTTNLRNTSRIIFRYGVPKDQKAIVSTSSGHSQYVTSQKFNDRCLTELGYLPARILDRINETDVEFIPNKTSLQADPMDPLDP